MLYLLSYYKTVMLSGFNFIKIALFASLLAGGLASSSFKENVVAKKSPPQTVTIHLRLKDNIPFSVYLAPLKYNKQKAYSFTLDDGYRSAYLTAFSLLHGGTVSPAFPDEWKNDQGGDGTYSPGLFYSNGCGQNIPFRLGLAINAGSIGDKPENRGHVSWPEIQQMYDAGWDMLNHGYYHATKPSTDFLTEVTRNTFAVKEKSGITMSQFVVPGGEHEPGYEKEYEKYALANGSFSVASYSGSGPIIDVDKPVNLDGMIYARTFLQSAEKPDAKIVNGWLKRLDSVMKQPQHLWYNEFTHSTGNSNLWSLSIVFPDFKQYMTTIANSYGVNGSDTLWMASWQEVYEYIWLRDHTTITYTQKGRDVIITLQLPQVPESFRYRELSLVVDTKSGFSVEKTSTAKINHDGTTKHSLLNIKIN